MSRPRYHLVELADKKYASPVQAGIRYLRTELEHIATRMWPQALLQHFQFDSGNFNTTGNTQKVVGARGCAQPLGSRMDFDQIRQEYIEFVRTRQHADPIIRFRFEKILALEISIDPQGRYTYVHTPFIRVLKFSNPFQIKSNQNE